MGQTTHDERTGWVGWIVFAATMMIVGGTLNAFYGLIAIVNDEWVVFGNQADLYLDLTAWGWVHLVLGLVVLAAGIFLFRASTLARAVAVVVAALSIVANFLWLPAYPIWSVVVMTTDVLVIYAVTAHGRELHV
jgi:hypothetical protein